jgi:16S rRNA G1207 methylase RsmC
MQSHYFTPPSEANQARTYTIKTSIAGLSCSLTTCKGLFAYDQVDTGTRMLLETFAIEGKIPAIQTAALQCLDLACGYGIVSYWLASFLTQKKVTF